jgi:hypothetical protein
LLLVELVEQPHRYLVMELIMPLLRIYTDSMVVAAVELVVVLVPLVQEEVLFLDMEDCQPVMVQDTVLVVVGRLVAKLGTVLVGWF